ncbi:hypothetical protein D9M71_376980 [compost metagenome]
MLDGGGQFLAVHQKAAVAGEAQHRAPRCGQCGGDGCRHAVAHRAVGGGELGAEGGVLVEAVQPYRVVAGAVAEDAVLRQVLAQPGHDLAHLHRAGRGRAVEVAAVVLVELLDPGRMAAGVHVGQCGGLGGEGFRAAGDGQRRLVDAAQFFEAGVHVDQRLPRGGDVQQAVAAAADFAQPAADHQQQVGLLHGRAQLRAGGQAEVAGVLRVAVVEQVLATERQGHRQALALGEGAHVGDRLGRPATAAEHQQRALGLFQQCLHFFQLGWRRMAVDAPAGQGVGHLDHVGEHVLRQYHHHRPGAAADGALEGLGQLLRQAPGVFDLHHPLGQRGIHLLVVDFLEGFAAELVAGHLADEQQHWR